MKKLFAILAILFVSTPVCYGQAYMNAGDLSKNTALELTDEIMVADDPDASPEMQWADVDEVMALGVLKLDTLAALQAYTGDATVVYVKSVDGTYIYSAGDYSTHCAIDTIGGAYNQKSGVSTSTAAWVRAGVGEGKKLTPNMFTANTTPGTTDMTSSIQTMVNVSNITGTRMQLLAERYLTDDIYCYYDAVNNALFPETTMNRIGGMVIEGAGVPSSQQFNIGASSYKGTVIEYSGSTGSAFHFDSSTKQVELREFAIHGTTSGYLLDFQCSASQIYRVSVEQDGTGGGIYCPNFNNLIDRCDIRGVNADPPTGSVGLFYDRQNGEGSQLRIEHCNFSYWAIGVKLGDTYDGGITYPDAISPSCTMYANQYYYCDVGIEIGHTLGSVGITENRFEYCYQKSVKIANSARGVVFDGCNFIYAGDDADATFCIEVGDDTGTYEEDLVSGVRFTNCLFEDLNDSASAYFRVYPDTLGFRIDNCMFDVTSGYMCVLTSTDPAPIEISDCDIEATAGHGFSDTEIVVDESGNDIRYEAVVINCFSQTAGRRTGISKQVLSADTSLYNAIGDFLVYPSGGDKTITLPDDPQINDSVTIGQVSTESNTTTVQVDGGTSHVFKNIDDSTSYTFKNIGDFGVFTYTKANAWSVMIFSEASRFSKIDGSTTWDPANLADGAGETKSLTVTGAAIGDYVVAGPPYDLQDMIVSAYVQAADTVEIRLQNETGGAIDLASGTWNVKVIK